MPPFVARIHRDVVTLTGPDTISFLQGQLSQDVAALAVGGVAPSFLLQPTGKVEAWLRVDRAAPETVRLDVDAGFGAAVVARLERFKLRTRTEITLDEEVPVLAVRGAEVIDGVPTVWPGPGSDVFDVDPGFRPSDLPADAVEYDDEVFEGARIAAGVPRMGAEIDEGTIPAELGQWVIDASVSFTKGCYTGQELVARIDSRGGNVPRHLRVIEVDGLPAGRGAEIVVDGRAVGTITSEAIDAAGRSIALAFVHRSVEAPAAAEVDGQPATIHAPPLPSD